MLSCNSHRVDLTFDAAIAKSSWNQNSIDFFEQSARLFPLDVFTLYPQNAHLRAISDAGMIERFIHRLVRVLMLSVLADERDRNLGLGMTQTMQ